MRNDALRRDPVVGIEEDRIALGGHVERLVDPRRSETGTFFTTSRTVCVCTVEVEFAVVVCRFDEQCRFLERLYASSVLADDFAEVPEQVLIKALETFRIK